MTLEQTTTTPARSWTPTRAQVWAFSKKLLLTIVLVTVELWAFTLSFNHHVETAIGAGYTPELAPLYPLVIDGAIVAATLVLVWWPHLSTGNRAYIWFAIATWTTISGINNAISTLTGETTNLAFPVELAIAIHTVPTVTQFLVLHIVYKALRSDQTTTSINSARLPNRITAAINALKNTPTPQRQEPPRSPRRKASAETEGAPAPTAQRRPLTEGLPTAAEMLERNESGETVEAIALTLNGARKKTWVHEQIRAARDSRDRQGMEPAA